MPPATVKRCATHSVTSDRPARCARLTRRGSMSSQAPSPATTCPPSPSPSPPPSSEWKVWVEVPSWVDIRWHARLKALRKAMNDVMAVNPGLLGRLIPHAVKVDAMLARPEASVGDTAALLEAVLPVVQESDSGNLWRAYGSLLEIYMSL
jgi:hypothetical protein